MRTKYESLTPTQKITRAHVQLGKHPEFCLLTGIMMMGESLVKDNIRTAYTNGRDKYYSSRLLEELEEVEINFVVAHENFHVMLKQMTTWVTLWRINKELTNQAADYVINSMIKEMDPDENIVRLPKWVLYDDMFKGWDTKRVFDYLHNPNNPPPGRPCKDGDVPDCIKDGMGQGESFDEHGWEEAKEMDAGESKQLAEDIDSAIRQGNILAAKAGSSNSKRIIGELTAPTVNWREQLREFVTNVCAGRDASTWRRPNRRWLAQDIYMPSPISETIGEVLIGIDTSGSIGDKEINEFLSELKGIVSTVTPDKVRLVYWDTQIQQEEVYEPIDYDLITKNTTPRGGGGTCAKCVKEYADNLTPVIMSAVIMLTDGYLYGEFPDFGVPTIWGITSDVVSTSGVTVRVAL